MHEPDVILASVLGCSVSDVRRYRANADRLRRIIDVWKMDLYTMAKLKAPGFMDLTVERLGEREASLTHYGEMNGDLMADPDMILELAEDGSWVRAVTFRNDYAALAIGAAANSDYRGGKDQAGLRSLNEFFTLWLENLQAQGHRLPDAEGA